MKKNITAISVIIIITAALFILPAFAGKHQQQTYLLEHEKDIVRNEPAPHDGGGTSTVYNFFSKANNSLVFRKRVLHKGAAIGYHLQKEEEIYYILGGVGEMTMNNKKFTVTAGDGILTFGGSSHGLKQTGNEDLVLIISYKK